ncbi:innexin shaking-B-like [Artemia franciscana]|uniref:innexin shaking-B-like n=1 Tax=Artemia franciscana TaxID=6661 RepID=UPI0032DB3B4B
MLDIFRGLKNLIKVSHVHIDSSIFRLHYSITVMILLAFSLIVSTRQYVGNPIDCIHTKDIPEDVLNTYCWIHSTYTIPSAHLKKVGIEVPHPGVDRSNTLEGERKYVKYYQWVCFCLFFQAILFYVPRWLWKNWEAGKIHALMMDLDVGICSEVEKKQKKKLLLDYLVDNLKHHNWWAYRYFFCEALSAGNIVGQMFLMDRFFDGSFFTFGLDVIAFAEEDQEERIDPMIYIFPRMTKCTFHKYGTSGEVEKHDALCILPLNIVNEKIYIFLWFWFLILGALSFLVLLFRIIIIISPRMRAYLLYVRFRLINREVINTIVRKSKMGDWFLLYMLGQNVDSIIFKEVMHELGKKLGHTGKDFMEA